MADYNDLMKAATASGEAMTMSMPVTAMTNAVKAPYKNNKYHLQMDDDKIDEALNIIWRLGFNSGCDSDLQRYKHGLHLLEQVLEVRMISE